MFLNSLYSKHIVDVSGTITVPEGHPDYFKPLPEKSRASSEKAWTWIEDQLKASTAMYTLVGGHYPVYSVCEHGTLIEFNHLFTLY